MWQQNFTKFLFMAFVFQVLIFSQVSCRRFPTTETPMKTTQKVHTDPKNQPGKVTQVFTGNESNWVPVIAAAVIVLIVFLISMFGCCLHCPFCYIYKRNSSQRVI